ncbi:MAG TPA: cytochrome c [Gaiellaceae bacterium]|nr:cytochrome c [Gaiellaceae bacterium]
MSRTLLAFASLVALLVLAAGCGGGEEVSPVPQTVEGTLPEAATTAEQPPAAELEGNPEAGAEVFAANGCGGCHTYGPAGSEGNVGPNLDESGTDYETAVQFVTNGAGAMPAFRDSLEPQQIADVAAYVTQG